MLDKNPKSAIWPSLGVAGHSFAFYAVCALLVLSLVFRGVASAGYDIHPKDAQDAWQAYSDSYCTSWLIARAFSSQEIVEAILSYCDEVEQ